MSGSSARSKVKGGVGATAAHRAVLGLRRDALATEPAGLIGGEDELMKRYQVGRQTLRKAFTLVANEQLVRAKRGPGGGYFARRPTSRAVTHMAAVCLQAGVVSLEEILQVSHPIRVEIARLAASAWEDTPAHQALADFLLADQRKREGHYSDNDFIDAHRYAGNLLAQASGNAVLQLFYEITSDLLGTLGPGEDVYMGRPNRVNSAVRRRERIIRAVLDRDPKTAAQETDAAASNTTRWILHDAGAARLVVSSPAQRVAREAEAWTSLLD